MVHHPIVILIIYIFELNTGNKTRIISLTFDEVLAPSPNHLEHLPTFYMKLPSQMFGAEKNSSKAIKIRNRKLIPAMLRFTPTKSYRFKK